MLKINAVCKSFNGNRVLDQVSFNVKKNQIIGLTGSSGSGKSTLLRCIQKLESIDSGSIDYDCKTGFMFQDFQLFPHMTVLENLIYAPMVHDPIKDHKKDAQKLLLELGISTKINDYPNQLSGGQKQRVALARSLMLHPELLLCDEPTSGLDIAISSDVASLLKTINRQGVGMIIASHDLGFLDKIVDQIIFLKEYNCRPNETNINQSK